MPRADQKPLDVSDLAVAALLTGLWVGLILLADPRGEFSLNDGWSYAKSAQNLVQQGRLELGGWTSMPLLVHLLWGALFCLPFGFSLEALRVSALVAGWGLLVAVYLFQRADQSSRAASLLGNLVLLVIPLFLPLSLTFMTDLFFALLLAGAVFCLDRYLGSSSNTALAVGLVLAGTATLTRQLGLAICPAFAAAMWIRHGLNRKSIIPAGWVLAATILPLALYLLFAHVYLGFPGAYRIMESGLLSGLGQGLLALRVLNNAAVCLTYLGLFLFPLLAWKAAADWLGKTPKGKKQYLAALGLATALLSLPFLIQSTLMPLGRNILVKAGIGPLALADAHLLGLDNYPPLSPLLWGAVTLLSLAGGGILAVETGKWIRDLTRGRADLLTLTALIYLLALLPAQTLFDRYLFPAAVLMLIGPLRIRPIKPPVLLKTLTGLTLAHLALLGFLSLAGSHDYMAWNRARWRALDHLTQEMGIPWQEIDGGFEFNGWHGYDLHHEPRPRKKLGGGVEDDQYMVAFGPVPGFRAIREYPYPRWLQGWAGTGGDPGAGGAVRTPVLIANLCPPA